MVIAIAVIVFIAALCRIFSGYDIGTGFAGLLVSLGLALYGFCPEIFTGFIS